MRHLNITKGLLSLFILSFAFPSCNTEKTIEQPNFIIIMADDLGIGDLNAYRSLYIDTIGAEKPVKTPNIDALATQGIICTRAYATAWCAPSRQVLMSGKFANRKSTYQEPWFGSQLRNSGYKTGFIGKSHGSAAGRKTIYNIDSEKAEFDDWYGFNTGMRTYYLSANEKKAIQLTTRTGLNKPEVAADTTGHVTDILSKQAVDFIKRRHNAPFALLLAYNAPHTPLEGKPEDLRLLFPEKFSSMSDEEIRQTSKTKKYANEHFKALVYGIDRGIGKVLQTLKQYGEEDNTIIVFTSDNGSKVGSNYPLSGIKHDVLEGGIRVPYIVWSKNIESSKVCGTTYDGLVSLADIAPTCMSLAGVDYSHILIDGDNTMPYLLDDENVLVNRQYYYSGAQRHQFGTKSKDKYEAASKNEKVTEFDVFITDTIKRIGYQAHPSTEKRQLFFYMQDAVDKQNPSELLWESYDYEALRKSNTTIKASENLEKQFQAFIKNNKVDFTKEWSGEYIE